jgi:hypothetical protein
MLITLKVYNNPVWVCEVKLFISDEHDCKRPYSGFHIKMHTPIIFQHLEMTCQLKPKDVAENIDTFREGLEKFLSTGALAIEGIIVKRLYERFNVKYKNRVGWKFTDYVKELKQQVESQ